MVMDSSSALQTFQLNTDWTRLVVALRKDPTHMREILTTAGITIETLSALSISPRGREPYGRRVLYSTPDYEVMLATWSPGAECAPHNHGYAQGAVWLVTGTFIETHYIFEKELTDLTVSGEPTIWTQDNVLDVGINDIHSMRTSNGGMSLHFYSPAIQQMKVYDLKQRRTLTVTDDCGAWVPQNTQKILEQAAWPKR